MTWKRFSLNFSSSKSLYYRHWCYLCASADRKKKVSKVSTQLLPLITNIKKASTAIVIKRACLFALYLNIKLPISMFVYIYTKDWYRQYLFMHTRTRKYREKKIISNKTVNSVQTQKRDVFDFEIWFPFHPTFFPFLHRTTAWRWWFQWWWWNH